MTKAFAFYFPQFCQEPLNDKAWYPGFTDWDLIKNILIRQGTNRHDFAPADGFYSQDSSLVVRSQVKAAKSMGLHGFCVYHYWFNGTSALQHPLDLLRETTGDGEFKYFLCWANESWTNRWAGRDEDVIIAQMYDFNVKHIEKHVKFLKSYFTTPGYFQINGRPVFAIYNLNSKEFREILEVYFEIFHRFDVNPYFVAMETDFVSTQINRKFEMSVRFEPRAHFSFLRQQHGKHLYWGVRSLTSRFPGFARFLASNFVDKSRMYSYATYSQYLETSLENLAKRAMGGEVVSTSMIAHWDNSPRYLDRATAFSGVTESLVEEVLRKVITWSENHQTPFFLINAWNEWTEGATLEQRLQQDFNFGEIVRRNLISKNLNPSHSSPSGHTNSTIHLLR